MSLQRELKSISSTFSRDLVSAASKLAYLAVVSASISYGATIYDSGLATLKTTDPVQLGRLNRNGILSDWSATKVFPGAVNTTIPYRYETFVLSSVLYPFIQITMDDVSGTAQTFASAYLNSYVPSNTAPNFGLDVNYLGDAGASGNFFGTDPRAFQVVMPVGGTLVLVVNDASNTGAGIGQPFRLLVEGFADTNFNDVPEPATLGLLFATLSAGAILAWRRS